LSWTDIHSHILPGFDDGASSEEEFLAIARAAVDGGTSLMVATPHYDAESTSFSPRDASGAVESCGALLRARGIPLDLAPGLEVRITAGLSGLAESGGVLDELSLGRKGKYMLVDLPLMDMPLATRDILFRIQLCGVTPILAHPERNRYLVEHPAGVRDLVEQGIEMQVDSGSLEGIFGKTARRMARLLLKEGVARLVASDAHSPRGRSPDLSAAAQAIGALLGKAAPQALMETNPDLVLDGETLLDVASRSTPKPVSRQNRPWKRFR
jgi:tyrosine-protein phosphatase YwqE